VPDSISDEEVRAVRSLCKHPELDTPEKLAAGPYAHRDLAPEDFAIALLGLRDKSIAHEEDGHWSLTDDARKDLCSSEEPDERRGAKTREGPLKEMLGPRPLAPVKVARDLIRANVD
jgi:hypothetical protein